MHNIKVNCPILKRPSPKTFIVVTLALGLRPRQKGCKVASQEEARE